ncbi:hypothetical protein BKA93DRAFT_774523 [Sparassis latifolia]
MPREYTTVPPIRTTLLLWGSLIVAAGVSYYYAKQHINERRKSQEVTGVRPSGKLDWRARVAQEERQAAQLTTVPAGTREAADGGSAKSSSG